MPKTALRQEMLARRRALSPELVLQASLRIQHRLTACPEFASAGRIALYSPILNEVFTEEIFRVACGRGKQVVFPRVRGESLEFFPVGDMDQLRPGAFGILEPLVGQRIDPAELDLVVIPGLAFDLAGFRLGFGRGFYDRVLHRCRPGARLAGLAFDWQVRESLPAETHDIAMDLIVTEERLLDTGAGTRCPQRQRSLKE